MTIRNPLEWGVEQVRSGSIAAGSAAAMPHEAIRPPLVARIGRADVRQALRQGYQDFLANRTDVVFLCAIYPVFGLVLARLVSGNAALPLLFPLVSGFALVGPLAAVGLYEMSRRRELGQDAGLAEAFGVLRSRAFGGVLALGVILLALFGLWLLAAGAIYDATLGPAAPASAGAFLHDVFATSAGWMLIIVGVDVGFLFAVVALCISAVSFPLMLDRHVPVETAIRTSVAAVLHNPGTMALWGLVVAAALVVGSIPLFLGLIVVLPVLGHATWHLYRRVVPPS